MRILPTFKGKINTTIIKDGKWSWDDYKTSKNDDKKILEFTDKVCPDAYTWNRQSISNKDGEKLLSIIENSIGEKIDVPKDCNYSVTRSKGFNYIKNKPTNSILLFCEEKVLNKNKKNVDRTAIDIYC